MRVNNYQELIVWQKAMELAARSYQATQGFPKEELYGLTSQIRRAASSIPANIAEGHGRQRAREFLHSLSIARGSAKEMETHLLLSQRLGFLAEEQARPLLAMTEEISRMLASLRTALEPRPTTPVPRRPTPNS